MCSSLRSIVESGRGRSRVPSAWSPLSSPRPTTIAHEDPFSPQRYPHVQAGNSTEVACCLRGEQHDPHTVPSLAFHTYTTEGRAARTRHVCDLCTRTQTHTHTIDASSHPRACYAILHRYTRLHSPCILLFRTSGATYGLTYCNSSSVPPAVCAVLPMNGGLFISFQS